MDFHGNTPAGTAPAGMNRDNAIKRLHQRQSPWDILIIGGGATGIGIAMDAASRGLDVLLLEQADFGKGTSSRSTKLVHGGVRYLEQGNITLVRDALRERSLLRANAPHLVHDMPFLIPCKNRWERFFYGVGLKVYDFLAAGNNFGRSHGVSNKETLTHIPVLKSTASKGGVIYHDGQFDDTRLLINMATTATDHGACLINYASVDALTKDSMGDLDGVIAKDHESGDQWTIRAKCIVNAAGPFCDSIRALDDAGDEKMLSTSQGVHIVLPRHFFPGDTAMIVPKTSDGRVIFIIPWHDHAVIGTTDTPIETPTLEPTAKAEEIQFLLDTTAEYLSDAPTHNDILSVFVGIRPLVKGDKSARTASLSRDHTIRVSTSGLVTITGGKWTTVRKMAEDCVDRVVREKYLSAKPCITQSMHLHGFIESSNVRSDSRSYYGSDLESIEQLESESPDLGKLLHTSLTIRGSDVVWAVRHEMARTIEDVLARRTRSLFLNAQAALDIAYEVAQLMATELNRDQAWIDEQLRDFRSVAQHYLPKKSR
ncbi:aerobic glycerol-3-phosphate dehydrogenase [Novipirellula caenicola]|uniref:Aerobic glycerol-3-phosphate dehydrogenase n=2 Tax=Novipirellula caenicola TaxID=1536901 RepID=A0ABP9VMP5_9BACT